MSNPITAATRPVETGDVSALSACQAALSAYLSAPDSAVERGNALAHCRAAARVIVLSLQRPGNQAQAIATALDLRRQVLLSGIHDHAVTSESMALAQNLSRQGAAGLLAATFVVPAWQWADAPALTAVPEGLWSAWTSWQFHAPQGFCEAGHAEAYAAHYLRRLEELAALESERRGTKPLQAALSAFVSGNNCIPLYFSDDSLRRHMELRGRLLRAWAGVGAQPALPAAARAGRRLRVGFINRHFGSQTETYTTLPTFERLDPKRFEVLLFSHHDHGTPLENYARGCVAAFQQLPADLEGQLRLLREARLDVAVFGTNVTAVCNEVTRLALYRVAPLQVVNNSSCTTSGLPEIDLYVSGTATEHAAASAHFTERLGLVRGPAHAFNYEADRQEPSGRWTRAALGLPEDAVVFVSAANYFKITPEMQETWARLLAAVPGSRLLLHPFNPNWSSSYPIKRFCAEFDRVLSAHGVASDRLVVSSVRFPSRTDVRELLRVGDLYLDTFPFAGVNSLIDPLETGVPVVTLMGDRHIARVSGSLLTAIGRPDWVAASADDYVSIATELAADPARLAVIRAGLRDDVRGSPLGDHAGQSARFAAALRDCWTTWCASQVELGALA